MPRPWLREHNLDFVLPWLKRRNIPQQPQYVRLWSFARRQRLYQDRRSAFEAQESPTLARSPLGFDRSGWDQRLALVLALVAGWVARRALGHSLADPAQRWPRVGAMLPETPYSWPASAPDPFWFSVGLVRPFATAAHSARVAAGLGASAAVIPPFFGSLHTGFRASIAMR